ncbi:MAG: DUF3667 domain-containing protein [Bacteroidota bacterium]
MNNRNSEYPLEASQRRVIERITLKKLIGDIGKILNLERGILYAIKLLLINPGKAVSSYLNEQRFVFFHPLRLLLITSAVSLFSFWLIDGAESMGDALQVGAAPKDQMAEEINQIGQELFIEAFNDYFNAMIWIFIPIISFFSYLFFMKSAYNYAEHLILNTYITSIGNLINTVFYLLALVVDIGISSIIALIVYLGYNLYSYKSFFKVTTVQMLLRGISSLVLGYFIYMIMLLFIIGISIGFKIAEAGLLDK